MKNLEIKTTELRKVVKETLALMEGYNNSMKCVIYIDLSTSGLMSSNNWQVDAPATLYTVTGWDVEDIDGFEDEFRTEFIDAAIDEATDRILAIIEQTTEIQVGEAEFLTVELI